MFRFSLQPLLNHRRHQEEALQKEMAAMHQQLAAERQKADALCRRMLERRRVFGEMQRDGAAAIDLQMMVRYLDRLSGQVAEQEAAVRRAIARIEQKRGELIEAVKRRKVIEKLREKAFHAHQEEVRSKEMALINEIAISRFNRKAGL